MSRPLWSVEVKLILVNGEQGVIHLHAANLVTIKEIRAFLDKAVTMADTLARQPDQEGKQWSPRVVGNE